MGKEYDQACEEIPNKWYENQQKQQILSSALMPLWVILWFEANRQDYSLLFSFAAASIYIIGSIFDKISTEKIIQTVDSAEQSRIEHPLNETNPFLPKRPKPKDLYRGVHLLLEIIFVPVSEIVPPLGYSLGIRRTVVGLSNFRKKRRLERAIQIAH